MHHDGGTVIEMESGASLGTLPTGLADGLFTSWSPDEDRLAIGNQNETVVIDATTGEVLAITDLDRTSRPEWLPDGTSFVDGGSRTSGSSTRQREKSSTCLPGSSAEHGAIT